MLVRSELREVFCGRDGRRCGHRRFLGNAVLAGVLATCFFGLASSSPALAAAPAGPGVLIALAPPSVAAGEGTTRVVVSPDGKNVYATNRGFNTIFNTVSEYSRDSTTGALHTLGSVNAGSSPEGIVVSPDGRYVYVANRYSDSVSEFERKPDGSLSEVSRITTGREPIGLAISPDGADVYAANSAITSASGTVSQFKRETNGTLTELTPVTAAGAAPHGIVVSPDGKYVYVANYNSENVSQYSRNAEGNLTALSPATVPAGFHPHDLAISPDGSDVYVAESNFNGRVWRFVRDRASGALTTPNVVGALDVTEGVVVSPDGNNVYATNEQSNSVSQYSRDTATGALTKLSAPPIASGALPEGIAISPDGRNIYVANRGSSTVSQYSVIKLGITAHSKRASLRGGDLRMSLSPNATVRAIVFGYISTKGVHNRLWVLSRSLSLRGGHADAFILKLSKSTLRLLQAYRHAHRSLTVRLTITLRDAVGHTSTTRLLIPLA